MAILCIYLIKTFILAKKKMDYQIHIMNKKALWSVNKRIQNVQCTTVHSIARAESKIHFKKTKKLL